MAEIKLEELIARNSLAGDVVLTIGLDGQIAMVNVVASTNNPPVVSDQNLNVLGVGNSLSGVPVEPVGQTDNVYDELTALYNLEVDTAEFSSIIEGGRQLADHAADVATMASIGSGNQELVIIQGGTGDSANYETDAAPLVTAANDAGTQAAFFLRWERLGAPGEYTGLRNNIINAGASLGAGVIKIGDAWKDLVDNTSIDLFADQTHQNLNGSWLNALCIYRYLTGNSVASVNYVPAGITLSLADQNTIKDAVDIAIDEFYSASAINTAVVNITSPTNNTTVNEGDAVNFTGSASDSISGDLSSTMVWKDDLGTTLFTGPSFSSSSIIPGQRIISAEVIGSDGKTTKRPIQLRVISTINIAPVAADGALPIVYNEAFTQINLTSLITDSDPIDFSTLEITQPANGTATIDLASSSTVNLSYSGTDYIGGDSFDFRAQDDRGLVSNYGTIIVTVSAPAATKQVWVDYSSSAAGPDGQIVNRVPYKSGNASDIVSLTDTDNSPSGWTFNGSGQAGEQYVGDSTGETTGNNSGFMPDSFLDTPSYFNAGPVVWSITGLNASSSYRVKATGSKAGTSDTRNSLLDINGISSEWNSSGNTTQGYNEIIQSDSGGVLLFTLSIGTNSSLAYMGGFTIEEL